MNRWQIAPWDPEKYRGLAACPLTETASNQESEAEKHPSLGGKTRSEQ